MALLNTTQQAYYQGNNFGNYQFVSLKDIINQFMMVYVGEEKIIPKAKRTDVAFHAQRALAELSFDTLKSYKTQEIVVPASLQMILPHDYVNYTRIMWSDSSGIKHPIYPTRDTQNPFSVEQDSDGNYVFPPSAPLLVNTDGLKDVLLPPWYKTDPMAHNFGTGYAYDKSTLDQIAVVNGAITFTQYTHEAFSKDRSRVYCIWQQIDVTGIDTVELSAIGTTQAADTNITGGNLKMGITASAPDTSTISYSQAGNYTTNENLTYLQTLTGADAEIEWTIGQSSSTQSLVDGDGIDVSAHNTVYLVIVSVIDFATQSPAAVATTSPGINSISDISLTNTDTPFVLQTNENGSSTTWDNYKSSTPSENNNHDYEDDIYWPNEGRRYGLEPSKAQVNGSFYIDRRLGKIHFSSNISGKTVILDYISDSLGTEEEMQVHKFAEEAMYKHIAYAVLAGKADTPEHQVMRLKKERFAETRKAKIRLSNFKLEELTQILRGKSKWIKH
jgi:hypothetical protein